MDIQLKKLVSKKLTTTILTALLISGTILTAASSSLAGTAYGQLPPQGDADGDGLLNTWETNGIPVQGGGTYPLPGANPNHKNLYVEVDYMENHRPIGGGGAFGAIQDVRSAFSRSPVTNPDGVTGINLFVLVDDQIPHEDTTTLDNVIEDIKPTWFGTAEERARTNAANLLAAKGLAFHYAVFAHQQPGSGSSGIASLPGMDSLVTLGADGWAQNPTTGHSVGTRDEQAGTFMHEFGHNLALSHGGNEDINCKTNYFSVQNYLFQFSNWVAGRPLDYSRSAVAALDEELLNERAGLGLSSPTGLMTTYGPPDLRKGPGLVAAGSGPVDWNWNGVIDAGTVFSDINNLGADAGCDGAGPILRGFNDWNNLVYITSPAQALTALQVQALLPEEEQTIDNLRGSRLSLLGGIDNAILRLEDSQSAAAGASPPPELTMTQAMFDTSHIAELLQTDQLDAAIAELLELRGLVIEEFGEQAASEEVVPQINNLVGALEEQKFPSPPPASDCTGTGSGSSVITGTSDPDTLVGTSGNNVISGLEGDDLINGCAGGDRIDGNAGDDGIAGGPGNDNLNGNEGDDIMQGDAGNDRLAGGAGVNTLTGGPGGDSFSCSPNSETTITDFEPGVDRMSGPCLLATEVSTAALTANASETAPETQGEEGLTEIQEEEASETARDAARDAAIERYISSAAGRQ
jgi:RTX calcium-binding nonapeptide repeat (4 copies)